MTREQELQAEVNMLRGELQMLAGVYQIYIEADSARPRYPQAVAMCKANVDSVVHSIAKRYPYKPKQD